jgi:hypothetical protein
MNLNADKLDIIPTISVNISSHCPLPEYWPMVTISQKGGNISYSEVQQKIEADLINAGFNVIYIDDLCPSRTYVVNTTLDEVEQFITSKFT